MPVNGVGPCQPWIDTSTLLESPLVRQAIANVTKTLPATSTTEQPTSEYIDDAMAMAAGMATDVLYLLSGARFPGECGPRTIRPVSRPVDADTLGLIYRGYGPNGYGIVGIGAMSAPPAMADYGVTYAPEIELPDYPVRTIESVYIDGVLIPSDEYELRDNRNLIRIRPTASSTPTERYGWPTSQNLDLNDTEFGTFSVTYTFGADPGPSGRMACLKLAEVLACGALGDHSRFPERTQSITRQGVTAQVASVVDVIKEGGTGIYTVDLWIKSVNPKGLKRRPLVFTPDRPVAPTQSRRTH